MAKRDFQTFKNGVGGRLCKRALKVDLSNTHTWNQLSSLVADVADTQMERIVDIYPKLSSGEKPVLEALLWCCDYAHVADELTGDTTYQGINRMDQYHRDAYLAILSQE